MDKPSHVEGAMQRLADIHGEFHHSGPPLQRFFVRVTAFLARPLTLICVALAIAIWIVFNSVSPMLGWPQWDPPPFAGLEAVAAVASLVTALLILIAQRREDALARHRSHLTLQIATQSEAMITKVIRLLEEQRAENPLLPNRTDLEAEEMARPSDPKRTLDQIIDSHREVENRGAV